MIKQLLAICTLALLLTSCSSNSGKGLKVAATAVPQAEMLEYIKPDLKAQGIDLIIIVTDDYNMPNRALANGEIAANFFQHLPFLEEQIKQFHYPIQSIAKVEIEPMGIYSKKVKSLSDLKDNATIAIPNDPTNEARALRLLQDRGLIELNTTSLNATVLSISKNPQNFKFLEIDAAMLPRTLGDVDAAAINTNYALSAGLSPLKDALVLEGKDSPYVNVLVVRTDEVNNPDIQALKDLLISKQMKEFIFKKYDGAVIPAY